MSFTFPNPLDTTEFTAANSITYSWDNADGKWRVKTYLPPKGPTVDLGPTPPLKPDGPSDGDLWFNTSPDDLTLYIYSEDTGTWIPAASASALEERVAENEALQIEIVQRLQANEVLTNFHSNEITTIKGDLTTIQNEIIELEEEIDAIAPSVERGKWRFTAVGTVANPGQFTMYDADFGSGSPTGLFKSVKSIWFNEIDSDGTQHGFADIDDGELLEIFVDGSPEFGLYEVKGTAHDETQGATSFWVIDVQFIRTNEDTTAVAPGELCRFKVFHAPSGGEAGDFVLRSGDTMTGNLKIDVSEGGPSSVDGAAGKEAFLTLKGDRTGTSSAATTIKFDNEASSYPGYITYRSGNSTERFFSFNENIEFNNKILTGINSIDIKADILRLGSKRISFQSGSSGSGYGTIIVHRPPDSQRGFTIKGKVQDSSSTGGDVFYQYTNTGSGGDSIDYKGICTSSNHIMNRDHADNRYVQTGTKGIKITKSSGNYYIQG